MSKFAFLFALIREKFLVPKGFAIRRGATGDPVQHPSNVLKVGYHIKEMAAIKQTAAMMARNKDDAKVATDCLVVCDNKWATEVSADACATLTERTFKRIIELPRPPDLNNIEYLQHETLAITENDDETT